MTLAKQCRLEPADFGAESWDDRDPIRVWQREHGLVPDGLVGPITIRTFYAARELGVKVERDLYRTSYAHLRSAPPVAGCVLWHDTIDRSPAQTMRTLNAKGYSTHYLIAEDGTIFETCDPARYHCIHGGALNQESIGVDVVGLLDPSLLGGPKDDARRARVVARPWSASTGHPGRVIDHTEAQKGAILALARALSVKYRIPKVVPRQLTGYGQKITGFTERAMGHFAHGQWSRSRWDGLLVAEQLAAAGFEEWTAS